MKRALFLHIGPPKTGTTALQDILRGHDNTAIVYPKVGLWHDGSHHNLVLNMYSDYERPEVVRDDPERLLNAVAAEVAGSERPVVISSEFLDGRDIEPFVEPLLDRLGRDRFRVEAVFVAREHYEWLASVYDQRVKDFFRGETADPDDFLSARSQHPPFATQVRRIEQSGVAIAAFDYRPAETLVPRLLAHFGLSGRSDAPNTAANVSLGRLALIAMLCANRADIPPETRVRIGRDLRKLPRRPAPPNFVFCGPAASRADACFAADRKFLRDRFGIVIPEPSWLRDAPGLHFTDGEHDELEDFLSAFGPAGKAVLEEAEMYRGAGTRDW